MFAVVLDTCVLWPSLQRDFLLSLAVEGLYRPLWSSAILAELEWHETRKLIDRGSSKNDAQHAAHNVVTTMAGAFDDACVSGWEPLEGTYDLPDPDDEHLVAAAVVGGAGAIVTLNLRDFPAERVPAHIEVLAPADFVLNTVEIAPNLALQALATISSRYQNPHRSVDELLHVLRDRYDMGAAVETMRAGR